MNPTDCYNLHWPICHGQLNVHSGPGGSLTAVLADLETIWSNAVQKLLEVPLKDLKVMTFVIFLPDFCKATWRQCPLLKALYK